MIHLVTYICLSTAILLLLVEIARLRDQLELVQSSRKRWYDGAWKENERASRMEGAIRYMIQCCDLSMYARKALLETLEGKGGPAGETRPPMQPMPTLPGAEETTQRD